jgi:hypothetical protein
LEDFAGIYHELSLPNDMRPSLPGLTHSQSIVAQPEHLGEWHAGERNVQAYKALPGALVEILERE